MRRTGSTICEYVYTDYIHTCFHIFFLHSYTDVCFFFADTTSNQPSRYPFETSDEDHLHHRFDSQDADWAAYGLPNYSKLTGQESLESLGWDDVCPDSIWKQILSTSCLEVMITMRWVVGT